MFEEGIHKTALVDASAELGEAVSIGAYSIVGAGVVIGAGTRVGPYVTICGDTVIGRDNRIFQYCSIGDIPQDKKYKGEPARLRIGDENVIREFCTIHSGATPHAGTSPYGDLPPQTSIGSRNWFLNYTHIAHDCKIGNDILFVNNATLGGHVEVEDGASIGASTKVHQFCRIGAYSFSRNAAIVKDLAPYVLVTGDPVKSYGLNKEGLKRAGFTAELIDALHFCYMRLLRKESVNDSDQVQLEQYIKRYPEVEKFVRFIENSERGVIR